MSKNITSFAGAQAALDGYHPALLQRSTHTLEFVTQFMDFLGNPQDDVRVVHVAGTSGKTSTAYYVAALLQAAGKKVGLSVSPHLLALNERVQLNLTPLPEKEFCQALSQFLRLVEKSGINLTQFEILAAFEYWYFASQRVDVAVIETGMGGLLDATNTVTRTDKVCVITDIGFDHVATLGPDLANIAEHKAGIIQPRNAVFCYRQEQKVLETITKVARRKHADLHVLDKAHAERQFDFLPLFQQRNLGLARAAAAWTIDASHAELPEDVVAQAARIEIPGRMQIVQQGGKTIVLDGAHNPQKMVALRAAMRQQFSGQKVAILTAFTQGDKQRLDGNTRELALFKAPIIVTHFAQTPTSFHQSFEPKVVASALTKYSAHVEVIEDLPGALAILLARPEPILLITGSLYLVARVYQLLQDQSA